MSNDLQDFLSQFEDTKPPEEVPNTAVPVKVSEVPVENKIEEKLEVKNIKLTFEPVAVVSEKKEIALPEVLPTEMPEDMVSLSPAFDFEDEEIEELDINLKKDIELKNQEKTEIFSEFSKYPKEDVEKFIESDTDLCNLETWMEWLNKGKTSTKTSSIAKKIKSGKFQVNKDGQMEILPDIKFHGISAKNLLSFSWFKN